MGREELLKYPVAKQVIRLLGPELRRKERLLSKSFTMAHGGLVAKREAGNHWLYHVPAAYMNACVFLL